MKIDQVDTEQEVFVIAEIGNNHEGDFGLAKELLHAAADTGVQAVKFQTIIPERLVTSADTARITQLNRFRFSYEQFAELAELAGTRNVQFMSTPFDVESLQFLNDHVPAFKIASSDNNYYPLLEAACATDKPLIISTGMATEEEVRNTIRFVESCQQQQGTAAPLGILHCVSLYPVAPEDAQLSTISHYQELFPKQTIGYSDHTLGIDAAVVAVALGAQIVEKHFTLNKQHSDFRDHQLSADPEEMSALVERIRSTRTMLGNPEKVLAEQEHGMRKAARRSLAARTNLEAGTVLDKSNTTWLRPGHGIQLDSAEEVLGKSVNKHVEAGMLIMPEDLN